MMDALLTLIGTLVGLAGLVIAFGCCVESQGPKKAPSYKRWAIAFTVLLFATFVMDIVSSFVELINYPRAWLFLSGALRSYVRGAMIGAFLGMWMVAWMRTWPDEEK